MHACMHACMHAYMRTCEHAYIRTYVLTYLHTSFHLLTYVHTCTHTYPHTHMQNSLRVKRGVRSRGSVRQSFTWLRLASCDLVGLGLAARNIHMWSQNPQGSRHVTILYQCVGINVCMYNVYYRYTYTYIYIYKCTYCVYIYIDALRRFYPL